MKLPEFISTVAVLITSISILVTSVGVYFTVAAFQGLPPFSAESKPTPRPTLTPASSLRKTPFQTPITPPIPTPAPAVTPFPTLVPTSASPLSLALRLNGSWSGTITSAVSGVSARIDLLLAVGPDGTTTGVLKVYPPHSGTGDLSGTLTEQQLSFDVVHTDSPPGTFFLTTYSGEPMSRTISGAYTSFRQFGNVVDVGTWSVSKVLRTP